MIGSSIYTIHDDKLNELYRAVLRGRVSCIGNSQENIDAGRVAACDNGRDGKQAGIIENGKEEENLIKYFLSLRSPVTIKDETGTTVYYFSNPYADGQVTIKSVQLEKISDVRSGKGRFSIEAEPESIDYGAQSNMGIETPLEVRYAVLRKQMTDILVLREALNDKSIKKQKEIIQDGKKILVSKTDAELIEEKLRLVGGKGSAAEIGGRQADWIDNLFNINKIEILDPTMKICDEIYKISHELKTINNIYQYIEWLYLNDVDPSSLSKEDLEALNRDLSDKGITTPLNKDNLLTIKMELEALKNKHELSATALLEEKIKSEKDPKIKGYLFVIFAEEFSFYYGKGWYEGRLKDAVELSGRDPYIVAKLSEFYYREAFIAEKDGTYDISKENLDRSLEVFEAAVAKTENKEDLLLYQTLLYAAYYSKHKMLAAKYKGDTNINAKMYNDHKENIFKLISKISERNNAQKFSLAWVPGFILALAQGALKMFGLGYLNSLIRQNGSYNAFTPVPKMYGNRDTKDNPLQKEKPQSPFPPDVFMPGRGPGANNLPDEYERSEEEKGTEDDAGGDIQPRYIPRY